MPGTTANISCGALGSDTTAQERLSAARRISGSASPVTRPPASFKDSPAIGTKASPAEDARVAKESNADAWSSKVSGGVFSTNKIMHQ